MYWLFSDTIKTRPFKLCLIITLPRVYFIIVGLMSLTCFKVKVGQKCNLQIAL